MVSNGWEEGEREAVGWLASFRQGESSSRNLLHSTAPTVHSTGLCTSDFC